jgi:hypothetical protein
METCHRELMGDGVVEVRFTCFGRASTTMESVRMAHLFVINSSLVGYNLDESEETLLIAAYLATRNKIGSTSWLIDFERRFFEDDKGVSEIYIALFNRELKAAGQLKLVLKFIPTIRTAYMWTRGEVRIQSRKNILSVLQSGNGAAGLKLAEARTIAGALEEPMRDGQDEQERLFAISEPKFCPPSPPEHHLHLVRERKLQGQRHCVMPAKQ